MRSRRRPGSRSSAAIGRASLLIESALSDRAAVTGALNQLQQMTGDDVEQALLSVVKRGTSADRLAALPALLKHGNADALHLALEALARTGSPSTRSLVLRMIGDAGTPAAFGAESRACTHGRRRVARERATARCRDPPRATLRSARNHCLR